jgi:hypothetical protein
MKRLVITGLAVLAIATGAATPVAHADPFGVPGMGCETVRWGFLGLTRSAASATARAMQTGTGTGPGSSESGSLRGGQFLLRHLFVHLLGGLQRRHADLRRGNLPGQATTRCCPMSRLVTDRDSQYQMSVY